MHDHWFTPVGLTPEEVKQQSKTIQDDIDRIIGDNKNG